MTAFYGDFDKDKQEAESLKTFATALELGVNLMDTAWIYQSAGPDGKTYYNEELVGKAIKIHGRDKFIICTKFGISATRGVCGKEDFIRAQLAESLQRLGTDYVDLYYMHRMDPDTPIEETMTVMKALIAEGKIKYVGLSECTPQELRRAHAVHPITAIQMEWSLGSRDIEAQVVPTARELGVAIVAYSPLCRGFLSAVDSFDNLSEKDWRKALPRFSGDAYEENKRRVQGFFELATSKGCTPSQLALAWVHSQGEDVFPIPGTKSSTRIAENAHAIQVLASLSAEDVKRIAVCAAALDGGRYPETMNGSTFNSRV